jgi:hypothetical protein
MPNTPLPDRLEQITRCVDNLNYCIRHRLSYLPNHADPMGATIGEMDWLSELHNLLYEDSVCRTKQYNKSVEPITPNPSPSAPIVGEVSCIGIMPLDYPILTPRLASM